MKNNNPSVLVIGDHHGYLQEQFYIEGIGYLCQSGTIHILKKCDAKVAVLISRDISKDDGIILKEFVSQGGKLLIINPSVQICLLFGLAIKGYLDSGYLTFKSKTSTETLCPIINPIQLGIDREYKSICPLLREGKDSTDYDSIFIVNSGKGMTGIIAFDLYRTLYQITHGHDVTYENTEARILRVDDGKVIKKSEIKAPVVDAMRYILLKTILDWVNFPVPKLWYFPNGCRSALCITHDSDNATENDIDEVNEIDKKLKISTTTFMSIFNGSINAWRKFFDQRLDLQFHPVQLYNYHPGEIANVIQRKVGSTELFLKFQKLFFIIQKTLFNILAGKTTKGFRFHGLQWNKLTDQPFWLSYAGAHFDSTLGSNYEYGYPYGSGLPYFLREPKTYKNLGVLEFPMHIMDSAFVKKFGYSNWMKRFFKASRQFLIEANKNYFSLVVINIHHYVLLDKLDGIKTSAKENDLYNSGDLKNKISYSYNELIEYSKKMNVKIESMNYFNDFWRKREEVKITQLSWNHKKQELKYQVVLNDNRYIYAQVLPLKHGEFCLKEIFINREKKDFETIFIYNNNYALFQLKISTYNDMLYVKAMYT